MAKRPDYIFKIGDRELGIGYVNQNSGNISLFLRNGEDKAKLIGVVSDNDVIPAERLICTKNKFKTSEKHPEKVISTISEDGKFTTVGALFNRESGFGVALGNNRCPVSGLAFEDGSTLELGDEYLTLATNDFEPENFEESETAETDWS